MDDTNSLIEQRRAKLKSLEAKGIFPFKNKFTPDIGAGEARARFAAGELTENTRVSVAGRITAHRDMGKSMFIDVRDQSGHIQAYAQKNTLGDDLFHTFTHLDLGDFVGVTGTLFTTKTGEPSIKLESFTILAKALRPPPAKWHGLEDTEIRYRQRYLDLIANPDVKDVMLKRSRIIHEIRQFLDQRGFLEVETPMMQAIAGGAAAQPFKTHHKALDLDLYLRIAPELYLKRLLVGGFPKVFELNRNFRNEGISRRHNPEFTMLEVYWAYADFEVMADLVEEMVCTLAERVAGSLLIAHNDSEGNIKRTINLSRPWKRVRYQELIMQVDQTWYQRNHDEKLRRCQELGVEVHAGMQEFEITQQLFEKLIEERTIDPLFVTHLPVELVPLAKQNAENPALVDVYELIINGQEISPGYSELNDPLVQRRRLEEQVGEEVQNLDEDFLLALEHGMPPAGGIGVGIDRLVMTLTGADSIREVILFPHLKPKSQE